MERMYNTEDNELWKSELENGMWKKVFTRVLSNSLVEYYIESSSGKLFVLEFMEKFHPYVWKITQDEWKRDWLEYVKESGFWYSCKLERRQTEQEKNRQVAAGVDGWPLVYWTKRYEAIKFIRKDRRLK